MATDSGRLDSGRFWLPEAPDKHVGGWLDVAARWPHLVLADPLTPAMRDTARTSGPDGQVAITSVPADDDVDPEPFTVHGHLRRGPRRITLVGATSAGRTVVLGAKSRVDRGEQRLRADYALLGGHVAGVSTLFDRVRLRVQHLDEWAQLPGVSATTATDGSRLTIEYTDPDEEREVIADMGDLVLGSVVSMPHPTVRGANLIRDAELRLELTEPLTFEAIWRRFVAPVSTLLSLCLDRDCVVVRLDLCTGPGDAWLQVRHPMIDNSPVEPIPTHKVLCFRDAVTLVHVARWIAEAPRLAPIPALVAGIRTGPERTLVNQLLDLATAVEGLQRRLPVQPRPISATQARAARRAAREAIGDPDVRQRVSDALSHLEDPTYAERLRVVTDAAAQSIPEVLGRRDLWEKRIKAVRNGFAHQVPTDSSSDQWREYLVLLRSLRWVLVAALLDRVGVKPSALAERLRGYEPYRFQLGQGRRWAPELYPD